MWATSNVVIAAVLILHDELPGQVFASCRQMYLVLAPQPF